MNTAQCNICRSQKSALLKKGVFGGPEQNIYRCSRCGHTYLSPLASDTEEESFYINEYPAFLLKRGDTKNLTSEKHFQNNGPEAKRRLVEIKSLLSKDKTVLEVGSATGFFLSEVRKSVKQIRGIEPHREYSDFANKKNIPTSQNLTDIGNQKFDLIFMYYVLEHIKDPAGFLAGIKPLLKGRSARLVIEVPNINEALITLYKSPAYGDFVWQKAHCSYFSVEVLKHLLAAAGLSTRFIPVQRYDISNHLYWLAEGKPGGAGKYAHIFSIALNEEYKNNLKKTWLCDSILAIARLDA